MRPQSNCFQVVVVAVVDELDFDIVVKVILKVYLYLRLLVMEVEFGW